MTLTILLCALMALGPADSDAAMILAGDPAADFNGDGRTDGRDVQAVTDNLLDPPIGVYRASDLARARLHSQAPALLAEREDWVRRNAASYAATESLPILELIRCLGACTEYEFLSGTGAPPLTTSHHSAPLLTTARAASIECARRIAQAWPGGLDRHNQIYRLIDLARVASLSPEAREILRPTFTQALGDLKSGALYGTNVGMGLWARAWIHAALGVKYSPLLDYGKDWGLNRILDVGLDDSGLFTFDGNDIWYWFLNSRGAVLAVGRPLVNQLTPDRRRRFEQVYSMPIRTLCVGGAHPWLGAAKASPKTYRFFGGFLRDWPGTDDASRWARMQIRKRGDAIRLDDLTVPDDAGFLMPFMGEGRPPAGIGTRMFDGRFTIVETPDTTGRVNQSTVLHLGFGKPINGGHQRFADYPAIQIIDRDFVRFTQTEQAVPLP